ncbi:MAG TPA: transglutaminaseTgpA domain-containing protein, partial [Actinoplanes sp.]|nr:transglutaminaseTgpA domain-containing protein [Actinoplanes sp.]
MRVAGILRQAVVPLALAGMLTLAGASLGRIYADDLLLYLTAGAAVGSVGVGVAARRLPSWAIAPLSTVVLAGYLALSLHLAAGATGLTAEVARDALTNGIPRLLTAMIPVEATPDTVVIAVAAIWIAGLAATEVAVRSRRVLLGCVPPVAAYAGALYVVGPNAEPAPTHTLIFAGLIVAALATVSGTPASPHAAVRVRALGGAAAGLIVVLGLIAAAGPWVSEQVSATPVDPRRYVQPPRVDSLDESPLNRISGWALSPEQPLLEFRPGDPANPAPLPVPSVTTTTATPAKSSRSTTNRRTTTGRSSAPASGQGGGSGIVPARAPAATSAPAEDAGDTAGDAGDGEGDGAPVPGQRKVRLRLAVLSDYDGVTWRVGGVYRNAGRVLPAADVPAGTEITENQHQITITGLTGRLLPAVPTPTRITGARVAYDAATGTLIRPEGLTEGLRYTAVSEVQKPDLNQLPVADVPSGDAFARYLAPGTGAPENVEKLAEQLAEGNGAPYDRAVAIEEFLAEHYRHVADAPSGHAYPNLGHFLFGQEALGGRKGTSEQFAAAYAVLARMTGLPSRVVVGFVAPAAGGAVTAGDALAWPEVYFDQIGWVAFDPLPKNDEPRPVEEDFTPPTPSPPPSQSENPEPT